MLVDVVLMDVYAGEGQKEQLPPLLLAMGAGGARIAVHAEFFPSLLPCEGAFSGVVDSLVQETFSGGKPLDSQINMVLLWDKYTKDGYSGRVWRPKSTPVEEDTFA